MGNHFRSIGFPVESPEQLSWLATAASKAGTARENDSGAYVAAALPDGGQLWVQINKQNEIVGCVPHFHGEGAMRVRIGGARQGIETMLDGSLLLWADPEQAREGELGLFPFLADVPDFCDGAIRLPLGTVVDVQVAAFANSLHCFADEAALHAQGGVYSAFAARSFIPSGLMNPDGGPRDAPEATGVVSGVILGGEKLLNPATQQEYLHLFVETLGGSIDVVSELDLVQGTPVVGGVALGQFWLSARVVRVASA